MGFEEINKAQEWVNSARLANGHIAYFSSLEGQHTPGRNSDVYYINKNTLDFDPNKPRLLSLLCDGVTGAAEYAQAGLGQFAAQFFCKNLPRFWEMDIGKPENGFSETAIMPAFDGPEANGATIRWLIENWENNTPFQAETCKMVMRLHADLFFKLLASGTIPLLAGRKASEVAKLAMYSQEKFREVLRLLMGMYLTVMKGHPEAKALLEAKKVKASAPYSTTTCCGVIELPGEYMFFAVGDSLVMAVDEIGSVPNSMTKTFNKGEANNTVCIGWNESGAYLPPGCRFIGGNFASGSKISIRSLPKQHLHENLAIVLMSDGFKYKHRAADSIAEEISHQINNCRWSIAGLIVEAMAMDKKVAEYNPTYSPDDKTIVVIRKNFASTPF